MQTDGLPVPENRFTTRVSIWAASLSLNIVALVMPVVILLIFDRVIPFQSLDTLQILTLLMVICIGFELALRWSRSTLLNASAEQNATKRHQHFLQRVLGADTTAFAKDAVPIHLDRFAAIAQLRDHQAGQNNALLIDLPFTLVFAAMIGMIGGWLVLVPLAGLVIVLSFSLVMKRSQWNLFDARKQLDNRRYAFLSEVLSASQTVKANRMERQMTRRFERLEDQTVRISHDLIRFSGLAQNFGAIFSQMSVAAMGLLGAFLVIQDAIGIAEMAACMLLNGRIVQPLTKLMSLWVQSENRAVSRRKLQEIDTLSQRQGSTGNTTPVRGRVDFSGVQLARHDDKKTLVELEDLDLEVGETFVISAQSNWSLQMFYDALTGRCAPASGRIRIDGLTAADRATQRGHEAIVILEDEPAILSGTLLENISAFGDGKQVERAKHFAAELGLETRIHRLPMGYNTPLGLGSVFENDPVNRQLIALTRVLALQPRLLIMSEPTAVLDTREREALAACLSNLEERPTIIMDSPDPRMKRLADVTSELVSHTQEDIRTWEADAAAEAHEADTLRKDIA